MDFFKLKKFRNDHKPNQEVVTEPELHQEEPKKDSGDVWEDEDVEEDEKGETNSCEWRDIDAEGRQFWAGFDAVYARYCERMLFFDRLSAQQLGKVGSHTVSTPSPRLASKKLAYPLLPFAQKI
ncbi:unnamed protein product [Fraxinus pennsylvanica]|uniref:Uncharacterized protein n=1 Tax=Fraxinus pennsylvanica TaxID=56036 RepID=A0AAD2AEJ8_9LAMI|nr:unnamed protein product [Fraxinus pennsylvanica]